METSKQSLGIHIVEWISAGLFGVLVALLGTAVHRAYDPFGVVLAIVAVFISATMVRAWLGLVGVGIFGGLFLVLMQILAMEGPGGDILMPADYLTYVWLAGGILAVGAACFTPRKWFSEQETQESPDVIA